MITKSGIPTPSPILAPVDRPPDAEVLSMLAVEALLDPVDGELYTLVVEGVTVTIEGVAVTVEAMAVTVLILREGEAVVVIRTVLSCVVVGTENAPPAKNCAIAESVAR